MSQPESPAAQPSVRLLSMFPEVSYDQWRALVESELDGKSFDRTLVTSTRDGIDLQLDVTGLIVDRRDPARLREGEERVRHEIALIARAGVTGRYDEGVERAPLAGGDEMPPVHGRASQR